MATLRREYISELLPDSALVRSTKNRSSLFITYCSGSCRIVLQCATESCGNSLPPALVSSIMLCRHNMTGFSGSPDPYTFLEKWGSALQYPKQYPNRLFYYLLHNHNNMTAISLFCAAKTEHCTTDHDVLYTHSIVWCCTCHTTQ